MRKDRSFDVNYGSFSAMTPDGVVLQVLVPGHLFPRFPDFRLKAYQLDCEAPAAVTLSSPPDSAITDVPNAAQPFEEEGPAAFGGQLLASSWMSPGPPHGHPIRAELQSELWVHVLACDISTLGGRHFGLFKRSSSDISEPVLD